MHFNGRLIFKTVSVILLLEGITMLIPFAFACYFREYASATSFFCVMVVCITFGETMRRVVKKTSKKIKAREGYFTVIISWLFVILLGAMPYLWTEQSYSFIDCWFESCAGWTTTGCTVMNPDLMPRSILLWKAINGWLGGMGIILLTISIFPRLGIGGQKMAAAEVPGPELDKLTARFGDTAKISYGMYIFLTVLEFLLLLPTGMGPYYALANTLSTISTSGCINMSATQTAFALTPYVRFILSTFSLLGGTNFLVFFLLYVRKFGLAVRHFEARVYVIIIAVVTCVITLNLYHSTRYTSLADAFGDGVMQTIAFSSTTGFVVTDISIWPTLSKVLLVILALVGGCGFSTSGGLKTIRAIVFFKLIIRGIYKRIHPRAIKPIMIQGKPVSAQNASSITVYILLYFALLMFGSLVLSLDNFGMETTLSAVVATISTNGTCFGMLTGSDFSFFSGPAKLLLTILMLAGRLELYAVLIMFSPSYWNSDRASQ